MPLVEECVNRWRGAAADRDGEVDGLVEAMGGWEDGDRKSVV